MVDMTGHRSIDAPLPPATPAKAKQGRKTTDEDRMLGAAAIVILFAAIGGLGLQFHQWWLMVAGFGAVGVFLRLQLFFEAKALRSLSVQPSAGDSH